MASSLQIGLVALLLGGCGESAPSPPQATSGAVEDSPSPPADTAPRLVNGGFDDVGAGVVGWQLAIGASQPGEGGTSTVAVIDSRDPARGRVLELAGDASTRRWQLISQQVPLDGSRPQVALTFQERGVGLQLNAQHWHNANVILEFVDAKGERLAIVGSPPLVGDVAWSAARIRAVAPAGTAAVRVGALLSIAGRYQLDDLALAVRYLEPWSPATAVGAWDFLATEVAATYPFETPSAAEAWTRRSVELRATAGAAADRAAFVTALETLLGSLADPHVYIDAGGKKTPTVAPLSDRPTWNHQVLEPMVAEELLRSGPFAAVRLDNGLGYVLIGSWLADTGGVAFPMQELLAALDALHEAKGIIIDVRTNMGGDETLAQGIAGRFTQTPVVYAKHRFRKGDGFGPWQQRVLQPVAGTPYLGRLAVLQSGRCMSSNEGFLMMMRALPNATTIGTRSRGASSNPGPIELTSDISVNSSRWQAALPDGTLIERRGVAPEVSVSEPSSAYVSDDPILRKAIALLTAD